MTPRTRLLRVAPWSTFRAKKNITTPQKFAIARNIKLLATANILKKDFLETHFHLSSFHCRNFHPGTFGSEEYVPDDYSQQHLYPLPPSTSKDYYFSPDKTESSDPGYSPREGESYGSPGYTEGTGSLQDTSPEGLTTDYAPIVHSKKGTMQLRGQSPRSGMSPRPGSEISARSIPSDYSPSSAMRSAQDLLKKNREKRLHSVRAKKSTGDGAKPDEDEREVISHVREVTSPATDDGSHDDNMDSTTEIGSVLSGSSVWTDGSSADRSSRRALILQMAKARMKTNKVPSVSHAEDKTNSAIEEEQSILSGDERRDGTGGVATEIDFTGELD